MDDVDAPPDPELLARPAEVAGILDTTPASVNSALQRAWERADVAALLELLADGRRQVLHAAAARVVPQPRRHRPVVRADVRHPWRLLPIRANGQLAFACYRGDPDGGRFRLDAVNVLTLRAGRIVELAGFLDPGVHHTFSLPDELGAGGDTQALSRQAGGSATRQPATPPRS